MIKENHTITLPNGQKIYSQVKEVGGSTWMIVTHGIGEHLGRHNYITNLFPEGKNIFQYDLRGHGRSGGRRGYVENFECFVQDLGLIIKYLVENYRMRRYVLFGHSMGALITANFMQTDLLNYQVPYPEKVYLSSPPVGVPGALGAVFNGLPKLTDFLAKLPYSIPLRGLVDLKKLSHDGRIFEEYVGDELNLLSLHSKLLLELVAASNKVFSRPLDLQCPLGASIGTEDQVVSVSKFYNYFTAIEKKAQVRYIKGAYHELHNEIERYREKYFTFLTHFFLS